MSLKANDHYNETVKEAQDEIFNEDEGITIKPVEWKTSFNKNNK